MDEKPIDFYTNFGLVYGSEFEVNIVFQNMVASGQPDAEGKVLIAPIGQCVIRMSPQHAKAVTALLLRHILDYEKQHEIKLPIPDNVKPVWDKYVEKQNE